MCSLLPPARSERDSSDGRRSAIYLPDSLATKLLSACDVAAGMESSEPGSSFHSDLDDLWSNITRSSVSSVDSFRAEQVTQRFVERYGLVPCPKNSNLDTPCEELYKDILEAAFGDSGGGTAPENEDHSVIPQIEVLFLEFDEEADGPRCTGSSQITRFSPSMGPPRDGSSCGMRIYYNRPHTPQVIEVDLSQKSPYDFWAIPNWQMKKPSLFPPTPRNIKDWIFWRRVYGRK